MSDSKRDFLPQRSRKESTANAPHSAVAHPLPQDEELIPIKPTPSDDELPVLQLSGDSSGDSPTIISKKPPDEVDDPDGVRGRMLAHFELIEKIGVGGMAAVLKARDTQLDRFVALKILPPDLAGDDENIRRFHQEARSAAKLDHHNIARVFFCGEDQSLHFIAFEFVEGENLRVLLDQNGPLGIVQALSYMIQITAGLCHAAERGVVHRDIKPSNIIITPAGRAKLVDMGLARSRESTSHQDLTHSGVTLGTFDYLSPEQAINPRTADVRSDIYSLGCTFYHMLTGRPPVPDGTAAKKLHYHQHVNPTDPRVLVKGLPDEVAVILDRMMAKRPSQRYQSAEELLAHLGAAAKKLQNAAGDSDGLVVIETRGTPPASSKLSSIGLAIAVLGVICSVLLAHQVVPDSDVPDDAHTLRTALRPTQKDKAPTPSIVIPTKKDKRDGPRLPLVKPDIPVQYDSTRDGPLEQWLADHRNAERLDVVLDQDIDIRLNPDNSHEGLLFRAVEKVTIRTKQPNARVTLRILYDGKPPTANPWAAMTVESQNSQIEGVRIILNADDTDVSLVGLRLRGNGRHRIAHCDFYQTLLGTGQSTSVVVEPGQEGTNAPDVTFEECCWLGFKDLKSQSLLAVPQGVSLEFKDGSEGGALAVRSDNASHMHFINCTIGPHATVFLLQGEGDSRVDLDHCSFLLHGPMAVFQVADKLQTTLQVSHSLFSAPENSVDAVALSLVPGGGPVMIKQARQSQIVFRGKDNRYHQLSSFWVVEDTLGTAKPSEKVGNSQIGPKLALLGLGQDIDSKTIKEHPWGSPAPLDRLKSFSMELYPSVSRKAIDPTIAFEQEDQQIVQVFQPNQQVRVLRQSDAVQERLVGVEQRGNESYVADLPKLDAEIVGDGERKLVDPSAPDPSNGVYASLEQAVQSERPGNIILIRSDGIIPIVRPIPLITSSDEITIRPAVGSHPILTLADSTNRQTAMFLLHDGKLKLEGLQLLLKPDRDEFLSQTIVSILGRGTCSFSSCVVTLDSNQRDVPLSVASHVLSNNVMRTTPNEVSEQARVSMQSSFVRGDGDFVRTSRGESLSIDVNNSILALRRSLLCVEARPSTPALEETRDEELPSEFEESSKTISLRLEKVTTWLGDHFLRLKGPSDFTGIPKIEIRSDESVFLASSTAGPFVHANVDSPDLTELRTKINWVAGRNAYGRWPSVFDNESERPGMMSASLDQWKPFTNEGFTGDLGSKYNVKLPESPPEGMFPMLLPSQFQPPVELRVGANSNHLPVPTTPMTAEK